MSCWLIEAFPSWTSAIGLGWVLVCFAGLCLLAVTFVNIFLPETKGHSVDEINSLFEQRVAAGTSTSAPQA